MTTTSATHAASHVASHAATASPHAATAVQAIDYAAIAPPLALALTACAVLLLDAFLPHSSRSSHGPSVRGALGFTALAGVIAAGALLVAQAVHGGTLSTFCVPEPAACSYVVDHITLVFGGLTLVAGVVVILMSMGQLSDGDIPVGEWYFLLLCALIGAITLPASRDLVMLVVALELVSLPVFALTALRRYDGRASEAAVKLFLVSVVSTAITLFGISLLYGASGTLHLSHIAGGLAKSPIPEAHGVVTAAVMLVIAGFAFKVAAVPFHSWAADVYQGASVPVAALLSVISKAAGFAGLILVLAVTRPLYSEVWVPVVAVLAALTMTIGNLLAMRQRHAVRLLAWSSVAQSGYILAPLGVGPEGAGAAVVYLVFYAAMNLGAFAVAMLVARGGSLADYRGLVFRRPAAALALAFFLVCLAGLPPGLAGLFAKVAVFRELVDGGVGWLAVVMAVNTVIGLYYYVTWAAALFTPAPAPVEAREAPAVRLAPVAVGVAVSVVITVVFSVAPQVVFDAGLLSALG